MGEEGTKGSSLRLWAPTLILMVRVLANHAVLNVSICRWTIQLLLWGPIPSQEVDSHQLHRIRTRVAVDCFFAQETSCLIG